MVRRGPDPAQTPQNSTFSNAVTWTRIHRSTGHSPTSFPRPAIALPNTDKYMQYLGRVSYNITLRVMEAL